MNNWLFIFLSIFRSPVITLFLIGVLVLHIPVAMKQSKKSAYFLMFLSAGLLPVLLADLLFVVVPVADNIPAGIGLSVIKLIFIISAFWFLTIFHLLLKNDFYHLKDKFLKVFNTSPHGMMIVKISDGKVKEVNTAFVRVSGYTPEDVIGKSVVELGLWHQPQQRDEMLSILLKYQSFGPVEYKFIPKTGVPTKYLYSAQLIIIKGEKFLVSHIEEKQVKSSSGDETKDLLKQRLREIMANDALYKTPGLTLADLAKTLNTNKTYLSQAINSEYGTFNEYLNKFRVIEACRLIQDGLDPRLSIDHLYAEVGFSSRTTFYEAFKNVTGVSPAKFRQINSK